MSIWGRVKQLFGSTESPSTSGAGHEAPRRRDFASTAAGVAWLTATHSRARAAMDKDDYPLAIRHLDHLIAQFATYDLAYFDRGTCYHAQAIAELAIPDLSRAIALLGDGETKAYAYLNRASARDQLGDVHAALADAEAAHRLLPAVATEWVAAYQRKLDGTAARTSPTIPERSAAYAAKGWSLKRGGALVDALVAFHDWVTVAPDDPDSHTARGTVNLMLGRPAQARVDLDRALELDPLHVGALTERGILHTEAARFGEAMRDHDLAIQLSPSDAIAWFNQGCAFALQGDYARAILSIDRAIELDPNIGDFYFNRARCHAALGRPQRAVEDFSKSLELRPDGDVADAARQALIELERDARS